MADKQPKKSSGRIEHNSDHVKKIRDSLAERVKASAAKTKAEKDRPKQKHKKREPKPKKSKKLKGDPLIEPSEAEAANGWTAKELTSYIKSREVPVYTVPPRITKTSNEYDPYRW